MMRREAWRTKSQQKNRPAEATMITARNKNVRKTAIRSIVIVANVATAKAKRNHKTFRALINNKPQSGLAAV
jgi:hypothetical protein